MDFSKVLINCSRLGAVMSEPKNSLTDAMFDELERLKAKPTLTGPQELKKIELQFRMDNYDPTALSKGCMMYLLFVYCYLKYGVSIPVNKAGDGKGVSRMVRGSEMEKSSFEIIKRATGQQLYKYKAQLKNDYLKGQLDAIDAKTIGNATKVIDIKTADSQFNFMKAVNSDNVTRAYNFQMQGYLAITGLDYGEIYHCLPDFSDEVIEQQRNEMFKLLCPDGVETEFFKEEWQQAEKTMRFAHIPDEERLMFYPIERDEKIILKIYEKVEFCREWLSSFENKHKNKVAAYLEQWTKK